MTDSTQPAAPGIGRPRRRRTAILLSLLLAGLGELYAGRPDSAVVTWLSIHLVGLLSMITPFLPLPGLWILIVPIALVLAGWFTVLWRADRAARAAPNPYPLQSYNRWYWYLLGILISVFMVQPSLLRTMRAGWLEAFRIPSASMEPTMYGGDFIFVSKRPTARIPQPDGLVVFNTGDGLSVIKRVAGLPGDTLAMTNGTLVRNGAALAEPYTQSIDPFNAEREQLDEGRRWHLAHLTAAARKTELPYAPNARNWGPLVVPPDSVFVLGDSRDNSYDSRFYGAIPVKRIRGKPLAIYFSLGLGGGGVRWKRIGRRF